MNIPKVFILIFKILCVFLQKKGKANFYVDFGKGDYFFLNAFFSYQQ